MSFHQPVLPGKAVQLVKSRNLDPAESLLAEFAAAGLIKTYALAREIRPAGSPSKIVRDSQIPNAEWDRIIASGKVDAALNGGTVRLEGSKRPGGLPTIHITGISFSEVSLRKVLDRYCASTSAPVTSMPTKQPPNAAKGAPNPSLHGKRNQKAIPPIKKGDLTASIAQTMQATSLGRTKITELMNTGVLSKAKVGKRTLISVESIERLVGAKVGE